MKIIIYLMLILILLSCSNKKSQSVSNTNNLKEVSAHSEKILEYYYDNENQKKLTDTILFRFGNDYGIHLKAKINKSDTLDFLFDTGANAIVSRTQQHEIVSQYSARRTFSTIMVRKLPLPQVQKMTGHKKLQTLQKYVNEDKNSLVEALRKTA